MTEAKNTPEIIPPQKLRIAVAEDDRLVSMLLGMQLGMVDNSEHFILKRGEEMLERLRGEKKEGKKIDLLITDYGLEGAMDGLQLADVVRDESLAGSVVLLTGRAGELDEAELKEKHGIQRLLGKPYNREDLVGIIEGVRLQNKPQV